MSRLLKKIFGRPEISLFLVLFQLTLIFAGSNHVHTEASPFGTIIETSDLASLQVTDFCPNCFAAQNPYCPVFSTTLHPSCEVIATLQMDPLVIFVYRQVRTYDATAPPTFFF